MALFRRRFSLVVGTAFVVLTVLGFNYAPMPGNLSGPMAHLQHLQQAQAQGGRMRPIVLGQTEGWAKGELTVFDYTQNFICANSPLNTAECVVGTETALNITQLSLDPNKTPDIVVIVPFFDSTAAADGNTFPEFLEGAPGAPALGADTFVQCPETQSSVLGAPPGTAFGSFGHCILHDTFLDLTPVVSVLAGVVIPGVVLGADTSVTVAELLVALGVGGSLTDLAGFQDDPAIVDLPLPNHTHIVEATPGGSVPWDIKVVLVRNQTLWPNANGMCSGPAAFCLTSFDAINAVLAAQASGALPALSIIGPVPSTLFLFFGVRGLNP